MPKRRTRDEHRDYQQQLYAKRPKPPKPTGLSAVDWATKHYVISRKHLGFTDAGEDRWRRERWKPLKYLADFMAVCGSSQRPQAVVLWKAAQVGFTQTICAFQAWELLENAGSVLNVLPNDNAANAWHSDYIEDMFDIMPSLEQLKNSTENRIRTKGKRKSFDTGANLITQGGGVGNRFRSKVSSVICLDELDGYDEINEGTPWVLGRRGIQNTGGLLIAGSTPTTANGPSPVIEAWKGTPIQFIFVARCPLCNELDALTWENLWFSEEGDIAERAATAEMRCGRCGGAWKHKQLDAAIEGGRWQEAELAADAGSNEKPMFPDPVWDGAYIENGNMVSAKGDIVQWPDQVGFAINGLYSRWHTWPKMVNKWLSAQNDAKQLRVFVEQSLARPFNDDVDPIPPSVIRSSAIPRSALPKEYRLCVAAIDVQNKWLSAHVVSFASPRDGIIVDRHEFHGDIDRIDGSAWLLCKAWLMSRPKYGGYPIRIAVIDTGYMSDVTVINGQRLRFPNTFFVKGAGGWDRPTSKRAQHAKVRGQPYPLFIVGVDPLKETLRKLLSVGKMRIVSEMPEEVEQELVSEVLIWHKSHGKKTKRWDQIDNRNEALDCTIYAMSAVGIAGFTPPMIANIKLPGAAKRRRSMSTLERLQASGVAS